MTDTPPQMTLKQWVDSKWAKLATRIVIWSLPFIGATISWMVYDSREVAQETSNALEIRTRDSDKRNSDLTWKIIRIEDNVEEVQEGQRSLARDMDFVKQLLVDERNREIATR